MTEYNPPKELLSAKTYSENPINQLMGDRLYVIRTLMADITGEIKGHETLYRQLTEQIKRDICWVGTRLSESEMFAPLRSDAIHSRRNGLEKQILDLEKEKRDRESNMVKGVSELKRELRTLFKEYKDIERKMGVINKGQNVLKSRNFGK